MQQETPRIRKLFKDLYAGHPWLEVTTMDTLLSLTAEQAGKRVHPRLNTIWEILNHLVQWRFNVLRRVQGEVITTPRNNYFDPVEDQSDQAWKETLDRLEASQEAWTAFLARSDDELLDGAYPPNNMSYYEHIHGIIHHDAYHLGQMVLLAKLARFG